MRPAVAEDFRFGCPGVAKQRPQSAECVLHGIDDAVRPPEPVDFRCGRPQAQRDPGARPFRDVGGHDAVVLQKRHAQDA